MSNVRIDPWRASEFLQLTPEQRAFFLSNGALPINDKLYPIWNNNAAIKLFRGGRGGGKSEFIADRLLDKALKQKYFKCYFGRKVFDTVRDSAYATLVAAIKKSNLQDYFHYSEAPNGSMVITCTNGNTFIPFGSDKADKLKSIKDPTHVWGEEFDQFDEEDFKELFPTLRTIRGENEFIASFNSYSVYETHWILKVFYPDLYQGQDKAEFDILDGVDVEDILINYTDNYFIDQAGYERKLKLASGGNDLIFKGLANGDWGVTDNKNPWLYGFNVYKHVKDKIPFYPTFPVYLSFDFNNDPFACVAVQMSPQKGLSNSFINVIREFSGIIKVEQMCERIRAAFPASIFYITGDRSGQNEDIGRNQTLYQMIGGLLGVNEKLMDLNTHNLEHSDSRLLCNAMLANYPNFSISREGCPVLVGQCSRAKVDEESKKPSQLLKDRGQHKNDEFDAFRYFIQTHFNKWAKEVYFKVLKK